MFLLVYGSMYRTDLAHVVLLLFHPLGAIYKVAKISVQMVTIYHDDREGGKASKKAE